MSCKKGGFVCKKHDNIIDLLTVCLNKFCTNVQAEPHLIPLTNEKFNFKTANTNDEARLDIKAKGFWRKGETAFFDVRVRDAIHYFKPVRLKATRRSYTRLMHDFISTNWHAKHFNQGVRLAKMNGFLVVTLFALARCATRNSNDKIVDELKNQYESNVNEATLLPIPINSNFLETDLMAVASAPYISTRSKRSKQAVKVTEFTDLMEPSFSNEQVNELNAKATSALKVKRITEKPDNSQKKIFSFKNTKGEINSIFSQIESAKRNKLTRSDIRKLAKKALALATLQKVKEKQANRKKSGLTEGIKNLPKKNKNDKKITIKKKNLKKGSKGRKKKPESRSKPKDKLNISTKKTNIIELNEISSLNSELSDTLTNAKNSHLQKNAEISDSKMADSIEKNKEDTKESYKMQKEDSNDELMKNQILDTSDKEIESHVPETAGIIPETINSSKKSEFSEDLKKSTKNDQSEFKDQSVEILNYKNTSSSEMTSPVFTITNVNQENHSNANFTYDEKKSTIEKPKIVNEDDANLSEKRSSIDQTHLLKNNTTVETPPTQEIKLDEIKSSLQHSISLEHIVDSDMAKFIKKSEPPEALEEKIDSLKSVLLKANDNKVPDRFLVDLPAGLRMIAWKELIKKKKDELEKLEAMDRKKVSKPVTIDIDINQDKIDDNTVSALFKVSTESINNDATKNFETSNINNLSTVKKQDEKQLIKPDENSEEKDDNLSSRHVKYLKKHIKSARSLRKLIAKTLVGHCKSTGKRILEAFVAMDKALERAQAIAEVIGQKFHVNTDLISNLVDDKEDEVVETFLRDIFTKLDK
nr:uncharacterized protein LOC100199667 [Hydra vulgaris]